ncbi:glucosamine-6-phosphate deaminase [Corynebacterium sp. sy017]|uniref:glucosamine-6-phosphate deaminase n=1 Tax=unclassified Corynebacterium TaxID=2624378 RepID=UPI001186824A|nr:MULTISPECIES: glucosamine-6-phosphate deaminase [unclassified Corynebacterium]MBP3088627.1 glucosamine-6-phosphate deaminase [Corynebacterium sp. sy017]TSD91919.1 glucosamine-6-phosphate deaminase [Corynebacterium sp. SY003]
MEIVICSQREQAGVIAADIYEPHIRARKNLGLATGSTPLPLYRELIRRHKEEGLSFADSQVFLLDEYVGLPKEHEQSYYQTIRRELCDHIDIADENVHSPDGCAEHPEQAAQSYDEQVTKAGIAIQVLGIGSDGHIGFNEPTSSLAGRTRIKTLHPMTLRDNSRFFNDDETQVPRHCITQGVGTIMQAEHILVLAFGENKADAVRDMVEGSISAMCPASALQMHPHTTVLLDEAAAGKLEYADYYVHALEHKPGWQSF